MAAIKYREEIDGLRAIAVLAVVLYHTQFHISDLKLFPGGFLGVDIFFVISGYLIAKILFAELERSNRIDILAFYQRRARRILPALVTVSIAALAASWFFLLPQDLVDFSASVIASILFVSNLFFYFETTEYGADDALMEPFLHTWSLSVEEQFYLVFPVLCFALFRWQRQQMLLWFVALSVASFAFAVLYTRVDADLSFYLPLSRVWELLIGAMVARAEAQNRFHAATPRIASALLTTGVGLIVLPVLLVPSLAGHPGGITVLPVLGTALVLAFGHHPGPMRRALTWRPMIWIGLLSYALYLWHFPIFAFGRMLSADPGLIDKGIWIALALGMSGISFALIERPFRQSRTIPGRIFAASLGSTLGLVVLLNALVIVQDGYPSRVPEFLRDYDGPEGYRSLEANGNRCHNHPDDFCLFKIDPGLSTTVVMSGDSHADALSNDLLFKLQDAQVGQYAHISASGCPILLGFAVKGRKTCTPERIENRLNAIRQFAQAGKTVVVYFARTPVYLTGKRYNGGPGHVEAGPPFKHVIQGDRAENLAATLAQIAEHAELILVYPMPELGIHAQRYFLDRIRPVRPGRLEQVMADAPLGIALDKYRIRAAGSFEVLDGVDVPDTHRIYPHKLFCDTITPGSCVAHDDKTLFYTDSNHPNWVSASMINQQIADQITRLLAVDAN